MAGKRQMMISGSSGDGRSGGGGGRHRDVGREADNSGGGIWRVLAIDDRRQAGHPLGCGGGVSHVGRFQLRRQLAFPLVTPVLEPDLHLGLRQAQRRCQSGTFRARQVALYVEHRFQLVHL